MSDQFIDPIIISIAVMDRQHLAEARQKYGSLVRAARWQFWRLWILHRIGALIVVGFLCYLIAGALTLWFDQSRDASSWEGLVGGLIAWAVYWLFYTNSRLNNLSGKWQSQERETRETLDMHLYTLRQIRRRSRTLAKQSDT
jgi:hypothetical protein